MKKFFFMISPLFVSSLALAGGTTRVTTLDSETVDSDAIHYGTNSNDRYNNLDSRTNSLSTPAHIGAEQNRLGEPENFSRMTGGSSDSRNSTLDWNREAGNPTTEWERSQSGAPSDVNRTTGGSTDDSRLHHNRKYNRYDSTSTESTTSDMEGLRPDMERTRSNSDWSRSTGSSSNTTATGAATTGAATAGGAAAGYTAQDTNRNANDVEIVRRIRAEIANTSDLSMRAQNVKIINQQGQIYLKGPVATTNEKSRVEEIAKRMAGNMNVINQTYVEKK